MNGEVVHDDASTSDLAAARQQIGALESALADAQAALVEARAALDETRTALDETRTALDEARAGYQGLYEVLNQSPAPTAMWQGDDFTYTFVNPAYCAALPGREFLGRPLVEVAPEAKEQGLLDLFNHVYRTGNPFIASELPVAVRDPTTGRDEQRWFNVVYAPVRNGAGAIVGVCHFSVELTEQVRARQAAEARAAELRRSAELIAAQQETIRALGTPLLPLAPGVLAMPLVGPIDTRRSEQIMEGLLHGVAKVGASTVILDVTGVETIDTQAANAMIRAAQSVRLLGARVLITGIQPAMAQVLVQLGIDLRGIATFSTLRSGIAAALGAR
ncbi:STAS domain-containing protein [Sorangium sp. So ce341]|uniref:STAS domain-containing protein n=1 Tax=Sorangium sp. So ce341 TaxID=3133302 RepID=UPI003F5D567D